MHFKLRDLFASKKMTKNCVNYSLPLSLFLYFFVPCFIRQAFISASLFVSRPELYFVL